jgi:hypothetical protein
MLISNASRPSGSKIGSADEFPKTNIIAKNGRPVSF